MEEHKTICVPFRKTGYCKYGDACKYLHIRDINEDIGQHNCKTNDDVFVSDCCHSFCESCVQEMFKGSTTCPVCDKETYGLFKYRF